MARLLTDAMLGRLTTYLRMCGHDTHYALDDGLEADDAILERASAEGRTLVTRDQELVARSGDALLLETRALTDQLRELDDVGIDLSLADPPARCSTCNGSLVPVETTADTPAYAPDPSSVDIWRCSDCGQHFWKGSHWDDVRDVLASIRDESGDQRQR